MATGSLGGPDEDGRGIRRGPLVAVGDGIARREAGRVGVRGADPRGVGLERQALEGGCDLGGRRVLAGRRRRRPRAPRC